MSGKPMTEAESIALTTGILNDAFKRAPRLDGAMGRDARRRDQPEGAPENHVGRPGGNDSPAIHECRSRPGGGCRRVQNRCKTVLQRKINNEIKAAYSLGKGEVVCSIHTGSTISAQAEYP